MNFFNKKIALHSCTLITVPACLYPLYDAIKTISHTRAGAYEIEYDTGISYLLFFSILITISVGEFFALRSRGGFIERNAGAILISNFIAVAILAPALSFGMLYHLESSGYTKCDDPAEISRVSRGKSYIFKLGDC